MKYFLDDLRQLRGYFSSAMAQRRQARVNGISTEERNLFQTFASWRLCFFGRLPGFSFCNPVRYPAVATAALAESNTTASPI
jgi:hypothetical protein